ncbi:unnamed protein product, partial [Rotaria socialis]
DAMKRAKTTFDFQRDCAVMFGKEIPLCSTLSGHYCIAVVPKVDILHKLDNVQSGNKVILHCKEIESSSFRDKKILVEKLHRQFCHPPALKLKKLITNAGVTDKRIMDLIDEYNDNLAMDLKDIGAYKVLHLIDHATRYSAACVVANKNSSTIIIESIFRIWISIFGSLKQFLSDNGGELNNDEFCSMGEAFNVVIRTTAAESPWSNGLNERHNGVLGSMVLKVLADVKCSFHVALAWSVSAKNTLHNAHGFSPNQLVRLNMHTLIYIFKLGVHVW